METKKPKKSFNTFSHIISARLKMKEKKFDKKLLTIKRATKYGKEIRENMNEANLLFSYLLLEKFPQYKKYTPYTVNLFDLVPKNEYTSGTYVAINKDNGELDLYLSFKKIKSECKQFPIYTLIWVLFHEFRHKIQLHDNEIKSVINYPNWRNFNAFMQKEYKKSEDTINHIFHELNPAEVDANIFACEVTKIRFNGNLFNINKDALKSLNQKK
jgi:hypothetical protein